jgi:type IV pilus assembly protein PilV
MQLTMSVPGRMAGVGLIEVMVAVALLGFGMLGIAALQATALRNGQSAAQRSQAVVATYAILERMRANYAVAGNGGYDLAAMTCEAPNAGDLAATDLHDWIEALHASVAPGACGQVIDCGSEACKIIVEWDDSRGTAGNNAQQLVTETRL